MVPGSLAVKAQNFNHRTSGEFPILFFFFFLMWASFLKKMYLAAPGLSCTLQDLVPWPGIKPRPPALGAQSPSYWTTRSSIFFNQFFLLKHNCFTEFWCFLSNLNMNSHRYTYILSLLNLFPSASPSHPSRLVSVTQFSRSVMSDCLWPHGLQHTRLPCPSLTARAYSYSCPSCQWCHPTTSSSVVPFSSCLQSFPASVSFPLSQFFAFGGQSNGASASVLPMNTQDWPALEWTGWISLQSKGLSRIFSNITGQKHQFFDAQLFL